MLDVGAGECQYKKHCSHLEYVAQDINNYDGSGDGVGLQTGTWDRSQIDIVCDLLDIPEDRLFDIVLFSEVLEHVPNPVRAVEKLVRLLKPGGQLLITAPFCSLTHFAPFHFATGFSRYFYEWHLPRLGCEIVEIAPNGGYFDYLHQEANRVAGTGEKYRAAKLSFFHRRALKRIRRVLSALADGDGPRESRMSSELLTFGWHVHARRKQP